MKKTTGALAMLIPFVCRLARAAGWAAKPEPEPVLPVLKPTPQTQAAILARWRSLGVELPFVTVNENPLPGEWPINLWNVRETASRGPEGNHALGESYAALAIRAARQTGDPDLVTCILPAVTDDLRVGETVIALGFVAGLARAAAGIPTIERPAVIH